MAYHDSTHCPLCFPTLTLEFIYYLTFQVVCNKSKPPERPNNCEVRKRKEQKKYQRYR
jgi:hypothetical protein